MTFAPNERAISTVRSVEPVSTTLISSTQSRTLARHSARKRSSFLTIMHKLKPAGQLLALRRRLRQVEQQPGLGGGERAVAVVVDDL